jgi:aryl-alcohol dehydrogenase-like predicted oxidoreductase
LKPQSSHFNERNLQIAREVTAVAEEVDADPAQVAIAWLLHRRRTIPILGARRVEQLEQNMAATEVQLDEQQLARLDNISAVDLGFPHEFLARDNVRKMLLGEDKDQLAQATRG